MIIDDIHDEPLTEEQKQLLLAWFDATFSDRWKRQIIVMPPIRMHDDAPP